MATGSDRANALARDCTIEPLLGSPSRRSFGVDSNLSFFTAVQPPRIKNQEPHHTHHHPNLFIPSYFCTTWPMENALPSSCESNSRVSLKLVQFLYKFSILTGYVHRRAPEEPCGGFLGWSRRRQHHEVGSHDRGSH
jgi:hypothetical protein